MTSAPRGIVVADSEPTFVMRPFSIRITPRVIGDPPRPSITVEPAIARVCTPVDLTRPSELPDNVGPRRDCEVQPGGHLCLMCCRTSDAQRPVARTVPTRARPGLRRPPS